MSSLVKRITLCLCVVPLLALNVAAQSSQAPLFTLKTPGGEKVSLEELLGRGPIVINFWATWCAPCILEMKSMKKIHAAYAPRGVQMLSISVDDNKTEAQIPGVVRTYNLPYVILLDDNKDVYRAFHVSNVPQVFVLDAKGYITYAHQGYRKGDEKKVKAVIDSLLAKEG